MSTHQSMTTGELTVRPLSVDFIENLLPKLPSPPGPDIKYDKEKMKARMQTMTETKQAALAQYWSHLREDVSIQEVHIKARDGTNLRVRVYLPPTVTAATREKAQVNYSLHGGGFVAGNIESEDLINRQLCLECGIIIFSLEYRLAPDYQVVTTIYAEAEDGLKWAIKNANKYGGDASKGVYLSGTSVGGTMVSMLAFRAAGLGASIKGLVLRQPGFIYGPLEHLAKKEWLPQLTSRAENFDSPLLNMNMVNNMLRLAAISPEDAVVPRNFPIFASVEELKQMPPAYIVAASCDPSVDEAVLFVNLLRDANVPVKIKMYEGMPHGFHQYHVLKAAREEMVETVDGMKWLLSL